MPVEVRYYTDPVCIWSWGAEPRLRRLMWEFEGELDFRWIMGGLARRYGPDYRDEEGRIGLGADCFSDLVTHWLQVIAETTMPCDPLIWAQNPIASTYPACQAVIAAAEQGSDAGYAYLRRAREVIVCERRKLDHVEALVGEAGTAGLDVERFRIDLTSNAITEKFGAHLEEVRAVPDEARAAGKCGRTEGHERVSFPSVRFVGAGESRAAWGMQPYETWREAALAAGARQVNDGSLGPAEAVERFGRCATAELEFLAQRPAPVVRAELWDAAREWRLRPIPVLTGTLWEKA